MTDPIKSAFTEALKAAGFVKKADTWYHDFSEVVLLANLQKSQFGDQYYVNLAVWIKSLGAVTWPKEHQAHVRMRVESLAQDFPVGLLDIEKYGGTPEERRQKIQEALSQDALPLFLDLSSLQGITNAMKSGRLKESLIHKTARDLLATT